MATAPLDPQARRNLFAQARRVVVKVGSAVLAGAAGLNQERIDRLAAELAALGQAGREVILVSSGAIAAGTRKIGLPRRPASIPEQQAAAAVGQSALVQAWEDGFRKHGRSVAQLLLTADDLAHRHRYLNARNTLNTLLAWGVVPLINENDTVMVDEIQFGDNDQLATLIASLVGADLLVILSDVDALYDADPRQNPTARPVRWVPRVDAQLLRAAGEAPSTVGRGGMRSKLLAAKKCLDAGIPLLLASGRQPGVLEAAFAGLEVGTLFWSGQRRYSGKKLWLAQLPRPQGEVVVDAGAARALRTAGTSLLPVGVRAVRGVFGVGAPVRVVDEAGRLVGIGLTQYAAADLERIKGRRTHEIATLLGHNPSDEVIHRDNFALAEELVDAE